MSPKYLLIICKYLLNIYKYLPNICRYFQCLRQRRRHFHLASAPATTCLYTRLCSISVHEPVQMSVCMSVQMSTHMSVPTSAQTSVDMSLCRSILQVCTHLHWQCTMPSSGRGRGTVNPHATAGRHACGYLWNFLNDIFIRRKLNTQSAYSQRACRFTYLYARLYKYLYARWYKCLYACLYTCLCTYLCT